MNRHGERNTANEWVRTNHSDEPGLPDEDSGAEPYVLNPESGEWEPPPDPYPSTTMTKEEYDRRQEARRKPMPPRPRRPFGAFVPRNTTGFAQRRGGGPAAPADSDRCATCHQTYGEHLVGRAPGSWDADACDEFVPEWDAGDLL